MKEHKTRLGLVAALSAMGLLASGCAARQSGDAAGDGRQSQYDTTGAMDTTGTGFGDGGTYGGSDTASALDTSWQSQPGQSPEVFPGTGLPDDPGTGGAGEMDTLGEPGYEGSDSDSIRLNPYPGMGLPGEGTGAGGAGTDIIPEIDSVDPGSDRTADSLDVPDWNSDGRY